MTVFVFESGLSSASKRLKQFSENHVIDSYNNNGTPTSIDVISTPAVVCVCVCVYAAVIITNIKYATF